MCLTPHPDLIQRKLPRDLLHLGGGVYQRWKYIEIRDHSTAPYLVSALRGYRYTTGWMTAQGDAANPRAFGFHVMAEALLAQQDLKPLATSLAVALVEVRGHLCTGAVEEGVDRQETWQEMRVISLLSPSAAHQDAVRTLNAGFARANGAIS